MDWSSLIAYGRALNACVAYDGSSCSLDFPYDYVQTRDGRGVFCEWLRVTCTVYGIAAQISLSHARGQRVVRTAQCRSVASLLFSIYSSLQCVDDVATVEEVEPSCAIRGVSQ